MDPTTARSTDIAGSGTSGLASRWRVRIGPWLWATRIRILFVVDGRINLSWDPTSFGLGPVLATLRDETFAWWVRFEVDVARRGEGAPVVVGSPALDQEKYVNFRFTQAGFTLDDYDQVWLFGDFPGNQPNPSDDDIELAMNAPLGDDELRLLAEWMDRGGGVFATGDHDYLGASMCYRVPRVRTMRKWTHAQGVPPQRGNLRHDTRQPLPTIDLPWEFGEIVFPVTNANEEDSLPQPIEPVYRPTSQIFVLRTLMPHPLLCGPKGVIESFPDHMHEGDVVRDEDVELDRPLDIPGYKGAEYPSSGSWRPRPQVVAYGRTTHWAPHGMPVDPKRYPLIGAYDGDPVGIGRVVVDSTWHHWFSMNLEGLRTSNKPVYEGMQGYYRNVALWLATPDQRASMLAASTWGVVVADPMGFSPAYRQRLWELGDKALDVIGRTATRCTLFGLAASEFSDDALERAFVPPGTPASEPVAGRLSIELLLRAVVGGIAAEFLELAHRYNEQLVRGMRPHLDPTAIAGGAARGLERGRQALLDSIREEATASEETARLLERPRRRRDPESIPVPVEVVPIRVVAERLQFDDPTDPALAEGRVTLTLRVGLGRTIIAHDVLDVSLKRFEGRGSFLMLDRTLGEMTAQSGEDLVVEALAGAWDTGDPDEHSRRFRDTLRGDPSVWFGSHRPNRNHRWRLWYRVERATG